ncbi:hypothetical protein K7432_008042 [Basidiobolus ranarum]|uniref:Uncharacterized protein n=1 Tax=Basidiobolus ranarum TaxID=34480 RepID=A0ABR2WSE0_9FUNG
MFTITNTARPSIQIYNRFISLTPRFYAGRFSSNMSDNDPDVLEKEKQKNLRGETKGTIKNHPGWNEKLASHSEASVKADRTPEVPAEQMQKETVEHIKNNNK